MLLSWGTNNLILRTAVRGFLNHLLTVIALASDTLAVDTLPINTLAGGIKVETRFNAVPSPEALRCVTQVSPSCSWAIRLDNI